MSTEDGKVPPEVLASLVRDAHISPEDVAALEESTPQPMLPTDPLATLVPRSELELISRPTSTWVGTGRAVATRPFVPPRW